MSIVFSPEELLKIATEIEKQGTAFYETLAGTAPTSALKMTFRELAEMERQHEEMFRRMGGSAFNITEQLEGYEEYLQALLDNAVFPDEATARKVAVNTREVTTALDIAINAEKDSIIFYAYLLEVLPSPSADVVRQITSEERKHFTQLTDLKKSLTNKK